MSEDDIEKRHHCTFEELKQNSKDKDEYWFARDLQSALDYNSWDKFKRVIKKAIAACEKSKQPIDNHFSQVGKTSTGQNSFGPDINAV